ncbi:hypothetical protein DDE18_02000 [Nocardioides gansuensis]|uniref:Uncharacterized protein n=1 Tax=Nocardioides gansuensis TaxID=2138300 RepID=A0A2T8FFC4_9ACTN|nr:hypothetical protein [Nocardioides gansuensis]PVG84413.1 hypothetical protein DDE18_02000 [Nocardioides gansuensis]
MADTFDLAEFYTVTSEAYDLMEELHGIDGVLDGLDERGLTGYRVTPGSSNMASDGDSTITLGTTHSFTKRYHGTQPGSGGGGYYTAPAEPVDMSWVDDVYDAASAWRVAAQTSFESDVESIVRLESSSFRTPSHVLVSTYATLKTRVSVDWAGLSEQGSEWEGEAADKFFKDFHAPFNSIRENHLWALDYLNSLIAAAKAVNDAGQHSVMNLVTEAKRLADRQLQKRQDDSREQSSAEALILLSTISGIAGALLFPVPGAAAALGSTSLLLNYAATQVPPENSKLKNLEASSAEEVDGALVDELAEVKTNVRRNYDGVQDKVAEMREHIDGMDDGVVTGSKVNLWTPIAASLGNDGTFYHESSGRGL